MRSSTAFFHEGSRRTSRSAVLALTLFAGCLYPAAGQQGTETPRNISTATIKPSGTPIVTAARIVRQDDLTRLVFDISEPVTPRAFVMSGPNRVILDLPEVAFQIDPSAGQLKTSRGRPGSHGLVSSFRFGRLAAGKARVIIDLTDPARIVRAETEAYDEGGQRLVVELARTDADSFAQAARESVQDVAAPQPLRVETDASKQIAAGTKPVVVIDPGHGGIDTGAIRPGVPIEKDLVLDFSRTLAEQLRKTERYQVVLTRDEDIFVPLGERVRIAQMAQAQLLVSVHADTMRAPGVSGATVYTVSERASDRYAAKLAEQENLADQIAGFDVKGDETSGVTDILFDLTRRETRAYSHLFARTLMSVWKEAGNLNKNPMRSAGFHVLKAPDVPSVLLEIGYLSSAHDAAQMRTPEWRGEKAASAVARSIDSFFEPRLRGRTASAVPQAEQDAATAPVAAADK